MVAYSKDLFTKARESDLLGGKSFKHVGIRFSWIIQVIHKATADIFNKIRHTEGVLIIVGAETGLIQLY